MPLTHKTVVLSGASSQLGVFLLPRLRDAGFDVLALSRKAPTSPLQVAQGVIWLHPDKARNDLAGANDRAADFLVSCGPLDLACDLVQRHQGLSRVVAFSTSSVFTKEDSGDPHENQLVREIAQHENSLRDLCGERGIPLLLLRPTLIYGCGLDRNVSLLASLGNRYGFIPLATAANGLRQPVHADDLAALAVLALDCEPSLNLQSQVCGGSKLSYREMATRTAAACSRRVRLLALPSSLLSAAITILSRLQPWRSLSAEMVHRQRRDLVFDDAPLRAALNYNPRPFRPTPADFNIPEFARKLQLPETG